MLEIVLGLTLVSGQLLNAYAVAGTAAADIPKWDFGFVQVNMIGYQAQVIPAILAAFTLVYLEKFFRKITPQVISMIVVPFCSLLLSIMAVPLKSLNDGVFSEGIMGEGMAIVPSEDIVYAPCDGTISVTMEESRHAIGLLLTNGIGDIRGIIKKPDYLEELGIDYIWSTPFFVSPQNDNGYDVQDYYNIDPCFGTQADLNWKSPKVRAELKKF